MSLYCISDPHLSLSCDKPMDVFGGNWQDYVEKLKANWTETVSCDDTVVVPGDISWGMNLNESLADFAFLNSLPGKQKILLKGNHDYFWTSRLKMEEFFEKNGLDTLKILHNNYFPYDENYGICGSRGWINESGKTQDKKILTREAGRLEASIKCCLMDNRQPVVFLHYPPVYGETVCEEIYSVLKEYDIKKCYYGHIHSNGYRYAIDGIYDGMELRLVSCDYMDFIPLKIF